LAVIVLALFVHEKPEDITNRQLEPRAASFPKDPRIVWFLIAVGVFSLGNSSDAFLLLRVKDLGVAALTVPLVYFAFNLVYALSSPVAGIVADKLGRGRVARWGLLIFAQIYLGFGLASSSWQGWLLFGAYGVFMAFTEGVWKAYLGELAPSQARGAVYGAFNAVIGLAALPASLLAGWFWDAFSHRVPFYFGALMAALASILLSLFARQVSTEKLHR
jgi:MFS family permease